MAKLFLIVLAIVAQQAIASKYDLDTYLGEIKTEIQDLTLYLEHVFPDNHHAITTVTWQCHRVAEAIQNVVNKFNEESTKHHENGQLVFKQLWFSFQEIHTSLQQIALSTDVTDVREIKKQLILNLQLVGETLEKAMHVTFVHYPEFGATLKTIFVDFLKGLRQVRNAFREEDHDVAQRVSIKRLVNEIAKCSQLIRIHLKEASVERFETFFDGVDRIVAELETTRSVGDDEIDVVLEKIALKLREMRNRREFGNVTTLLEQLVHFIENGSQHDRQDNFIQKIVYDYFLLVEKLSTQLERGQFYYGEQPKMMPRYTVRGRW